MIRLKLEINAENASEARDLLLYLAEQVEQIIEQAHQEDDDGVNIPAIKNDVVH